MKKAFISGTKSKKVVGDTQKLLSIIDYIGWTKLPVEKDFSLDVKTDRIRMILDSEVFVTRDILLGPDQKHYETELEIAQYLDLPVIIFGPIGVNRTMDNERLDTLVAQRVVENLRREEEESK